MSSYQITDQVLLDIDIEYFEYNAGKPILKNVKQKIRNITRPGVEQGQVVAILGPSGIGKSTLFELIAGLLTPTKGSIKTFDRAKNALVPIQAGMIGMVYQTYDLFPFLTVKKQLELGARKGGFSGKQAEEKVQFHLNHFRLAEHAQKYPNQLSGGQRQRLSIAQQLLCSNMVLLMDEPFSGLDPLIKQDICDLIAQIAQIDELQTIIIISHDIEPTLSIADTVWLLGKTPHGSATIVESIDLMSKGLCWEKGIEEHPEFQKVCGYVTRRFKDLNGA
jgi:ABC-type nitrate/sulfonate/bicarbonate transport system ATPase subunit